MLTQIPDEDNRSSKSFRLCIAHSVLDEINMQLVHYEIGRDNNMISFDIELTWHTLDSEIFFLMSPWTLLWLTFDSISFCKHLYFVLARHPRITAETYKNIWLDICTTLGLHNGNRPSFSTWITWLKKNDMFQLIIKHGSCNSTPSVLLYENSCPPSLDDIIKVYSCSFTAYNCILAIQESWTKQPAFVSW